MTDLTKLSTMTDEELRQLRVTLARQPGANAGALRMAILDEEYRREQRRPVTPTAARGAWQWTGRHDPSVVAAVRAERQRIADEASDAAYERQRQADRLFDISAHVRPAWK